MESYEEEDRFMTGTFPKAFDYSDEENELHSDADALRGIPNRVKPKIIIMGLRRSGKSSIQKVVFHKMSPNETLFLESTNKIVKDEISNNSFVCFSIWDFPGQIDINDRDFDYESIFNGCGALVFVIDSQDDYLDALCNLNKTVRKAHQVNPNINFEVFIHKVDGLSDDHKIETRQDIHKRANEDLLDEENISLSFYLTSIYDHSIFEAFSKVVQKLIPQMAILENLLNVFISNSGIEKAFLFDVVSKIFIATDSSPVDMQSYELCCDMIDVVIDISCIYGINENGEGSTFDNCSSSSIRLNSGTVLYLREVNKFLALVCILQKENFTKQGLIDYNFQCFRHSIHEVFQHRISEPSRISHMNYIDQINTPYGSSSAQGTDDTVAGTAHVNDVDMGIGSFENDALINIDQRSSTPINSQESFKQGASHHTLIPNQGPVHRKFAILPTTSIPSSLPNHQNSYHQPSVSSKSKLHSPNIYNTYNNSTLT